jgi:DNA recombination protein RmuC
MGLVTTVFVAACVTAFMAGLLHLIALMQGLVGAGEEREQDVAKRLDGIAEAMERSERAMRDESQIMRRESETRAKMLRDEVGENISRFGWNVQSLITTSSSSVDAKLEEFSRTQSEYADRLRSEVRQTMTAFGDGLKGDVKTLTTTNSQSQDAIRATLLDRLDKLRQENETKLEAMRATVEEKLQGTLEKRLGESFAIVSARLEQVHRGLGEMQTLAIGVGDLKRVMSNVKDRGGWAEIQLGAMLEQMLARDQYVTNAKVDAGSAEMVEYAVRMPGQVDGKDVLLPIDAKFPKESYERLMTAWESGDAEATRIASEMLASVIEGEAKRIATKYIRPPATTDFAVMYLPTEGLFAEAMRAPGLAQRIQSKWRVTVAGPTTLHALLNSLQMGFRTLAIQKRSGEVWRVLGEAKAEFQKYGDVWDKLRDQLQKAQKTIDDAGVRTRAVERKLREVEISDLPVGAQPQLELASSTEEDDLPPVAPPVPLPVRRIQPRD